MDSTISFISKSKNTYLYDFKKKRLMHVHPLIKVFMEIDNEMCDKSTLVNLLEIKAKSIREFSFSWEDIEYYADKYIYLRKQGFFSKIETKRKYLTEVSISTIEVNLANISNIMFEITESCNLNCYYCGYGHFYNEDSKRNNKHLDTDNAIALINYFAKLWSTKESFNKKVVITFYGGEPLLCFDQIKKIVDYIKQLRPEKEIQYNMTTNGVLLHKYYKYLIDNNFLILISLDGNKESNIYRVNRSNKESYNEIFRNIKIIQNEYPEYFNSNISFSSVLHNKNSILGVYKYMKNEFNKVPMMSDLRSTGVLEEKRDEFLQAYANKNEHTENIEDYSLIMQELSEEGHIVNALENFIRGYSLNFAENYLSFFSERNESKVLPTGTCRPFDSKIFLTANSKIMLCERIDFKFAFGKVDNKKVILNVKEVAEKHNKYLNRVKKMCRNCYAAQECIQCIYYVDNLEDKPLCNGFKNKKDIVKHFKSTILALENTPELYKKLNLEK